MKPALAPEEWAEDGMNRARGWVRASVEYEGAERTDGEVAEEDALWIEGADEQMKFVGDERHALAALCLHEQPFGFTRDDVAVLRKTLDEADLTDRGPTNARYMSDERSKAIGRLHDLADRIEALLPPEQP